MTDHKPLGCTVEEGLGDIELKPVFISKVTEGGNAERAGFEVGDVVLEVSGLFDRMNYVLGEGIDSVTSAVADRPADEQLNFSIARGTEVLEQHESALIQLCTSLSENEKETEECVINFLTTTYEDYNEEFIPTPKWVDEDADKPELENEEDEDDGDSLLENMFENMWVDELREVAPVEKKQTELKTEVKSKVTKPMPWRSRSSPSGTYVRDPKTGKMVNIDAQ
eukprot:CAMPEP_0194146144 /NCGR_PEP_ID=MMETSP0152-20130528/19914_1 /TAXON_ID=1049557 /ORGANISM="Thalassiothrix antarctica, Strain L6-D1" /LENGTH=223 /DNA_ID=CAMNT_0038846587 /DNA_START=267 /DNA_END=938 /DNA_ORIENTATION=+